MNGKIVAKIYKVDSVLVPNNDSKTFVKSYMNNYNDDEKRNHYKFVPTYNRNEEGSFEHLLYIHEA